MFVGIGEGGGGWGVECGMAVRGMGDSRVEIIKI